MSPKTTLTCQVILKEHDLGIHKQINKMRTIQEIEKNQSKLGYNKIGSVKIRVKKQRKIEEEGSSFFFSDCPKDAGQRKKGRRLEGSRERRRERGRRKKRTWKSCRGGECQQGSAPKQFEHRWVRMSGKLMM